MNPLTNIRNIAKLNEQELKLGIFDAKLSWHNEYKGSAYIFIGGMPYDLTEGDLICVFSQYGEIVNINLVRDKKTGKSKGYGFLAYEDQRSTILAVDNLNSAKLGGRTLRVDHVSEYRRPKGDEKDESGKYKEIIEEGCAPKTPPTSDEEKEIKKEKRKHKKEKKKKDIKEKEERKETDKYYKKDKTLNKHNGRDNERETIESRSTSHKKSRHKSPESDRVTHYRESKKDDKERNRSRHGRDSYSRESHSRSKRDRSHTPDRYQSKQRRSRSPSYHSRSRDRHSNSKY